MGDYGWSVVGAAVAVITAVFGIALYRLWRQLEYVKALADYLGYDLAMGGSAASEVRPKASLDLDRVRDEVGMVVAAATQPAAAYKQIRGWQMSAQRLEPALAFWVDFLRQLGLLFTVLGLGLSLAVDPGNVSDLLQPLGLAVWTTVAGLFYSLVLSAQFGMKVAVWTDTCEKNIEAWSNRHSGWAQRRDG